MDNKLETLADDLYTLVNDLKSQTIEGEITAVKVSGKNQYITIKNGDFQISCISWSFIHDVSTSNVVELRGELKVMKKNLSIYFNIRKLSIKGEGNIITEFNKLKNKVVSLGYCDNKRKLITFPLNIAIITSLEGAAIQDILQTFRLDNFIGNIYIKNAIVQGKSCPSSVIEGINFFNSTEFKIGTAKYTGEDDMMGEDGGMMGEDGDIMGNDGGMGEDGGISDDGDTMDDDGGMVGGNRAITNKNIDLLLVTRGGGSNEDLLGFSDFSVLEAIHNSNIITISAVGHQIDNQLSDIVADYSFATPSIAAKFIVERQKEFIKKLVDVKNDYVKIYDMYSKSRDSLLQLDYNEIIKNYDKIHINNKIGSYRTHVNNIIMHYNNTKSFVFDMISKIKPTLFNKDKEICSVKDLENNAPKKLDIVFHDGKATIYYKLQSLTYV
jgi:exonuclease VII large subunit